MISSFGLTLGWVNNGRCLIFSLGWRVPLSNQTAETVALILGLSLFVHFGCQSFCLLKVLTVVLSLLFICFSIRTIYSKPSQPGLFSSLLPQSVLFSDSVPEDHMKTFPYNRFMPSSFSSAESILKNVSFVFDYVCICELISFGVNGRSALLIFQHSKRVKSLFSGRLHLMAYKNLLQKLWNLISSPWLGELMIYILLH